MSRDTMLDEAIAKAKEAKNWQMVGWLRTARGANASARYYTEKNECLKAKNAKLQELVQKMMRFFEDGDWCDICECAKECDALEQYEEDCLMRGVFHDRMRELGVED